MLQVVVVLYVTILGVQAVDQPAAGASTEILSKILSKHCALKYSLSCLKVDAVKLVDRLSLTQAYRLLPGVSLVHTNYTLLSSLPLEVLAPLVSGNDSALDSLLADRVSNYLNSLTLSVKLLDSGTVSSARALSEQILERSDQVTGRRKGGGGAALIAGATLAAVGLAGLAAMAGKAMMASMLALMLSAGGALRGGGGGGGGGGHGGGKDCSYAITAGKRSIAVQEHPVYRHP